jgi:Gpi18-like mannosyltransferase
MDAVSAVAIGISVAAFPFALWFIYRIAKQLHSTPTARAATLALSFFPTAFFLNAAYTESLFLALSAGAVWAARVRRDFLLACLLAALATARATSGCSC